MIKKVYIQKIGLITADVLAVLSSYYLATLLTNLYAKTDFHRLNLNHWPLLKILDLLLLLGLMWHRQIYFKRRPNWEELRLTYRALFTLFLINLPVLFIKNNYSYINLVFILFWLGLYLLIPLYRLFVKLALAYLGLWQRDVYIIGVNSEAFATYRLIQPSKLLGYNVCAFVDVRQPVVSTKVNLSGLEFPVLDLQHLFASSHEAEVILCLGGKYLSDHIKLINHLQQQFLGVTIVPELKGLPLYGIEVSPFFGNEQILMRLENNLSSRFNRLIKYSFDLGLALLLLLPVIFIFIIVSFLIYIEDRGNPFFRQIRVGANGKLFKCYKFRTMSKSAESMLNEWQENNHHLYQEYVQNNFKLKNDPRITKIGKFLRRSSLDELPQLINVFLGEMSLVGPRPLIASEVKDYHEGLFYYNQVRPGITGLWQISGRSNTSFADRCRLDTWYVRNWTIWADVVILIKTFEAILFRSGAY